MRPFHRYWAGVAIADALVVLRSDQRSDALAIADNEKRKLFPLQAFFEYNLRARFADHFAAEHFGGHRCGFFFGLGDDDAFSSGQSVCFDHNRRVEVWKRGANLLDGPADHVVRRRYVVALHELLGKALA